MISPGPVVVTATFVGYLLNGFTGAVAATLGIFLPKYRSNKWVRGFLRGVTVTVVGVLSGTTYLVGRTAIGDWVTLVIAVFALLLAMRSRVPDQILVGAGALVGLATYVFVHPEWMLR